MNPGIKTAPEIILKVVYFKWLDNKGAKGDGAPRRADVRALGSNSQELGEIKVLYRRSPHHIFPTHFV